MLAQHFELPVQVVAAGHEHRLGAVPVDLVEQPLDAVRGGGGEDDRLAQVVAEARREVAHPDLVPGLPDTRQVGAQISERGREMIETHRAPAFSRRPAADHERSSEIVTALLLYRPVVKVSRL
ncbi:Uncharacterised protein [Mycobacteroides abscessus subsp. abscessus]|nr:Uncharacterised protein [Mycobacteroides abscessus subsp. abscessus]